MANITWGDGHADQRPHVIEHIDIGSGAIGCRCGTWVMQGEHLSLEVAWEIHRGHKDFRPSVYQAAELATDREVEQFFEDNLGDLPARARIRSTPEGWGAWQEGAITDESLDSAYEWLEAVRGMQARCTCATMPVEACPNYVEGDEDA